MEAKTLALYLGCDCRAKYVDWDSWAEIHKMSLATLQRMESDLSFQVMPILRPLSGMSEEEAKELFLLERSSQWVGRLIEFKKFLSTTISIPTL